ncbi:hypothetical protein NL108_006363 [Boleophthalmus pectinirostris]|uniref:chitinase-3-like protein 2 n=1 Tax=Boleophthalmus pectinirostris TaxID=150288 RepID=UPI00242CC21E|nr:chitinase-3-like protein 2 [Boleophthalmus pectinirostris]KAJ0064344.1 hypothetical protein NL108_006363 [Boleophthalmus pectinirostris]
MHGILLTTGLFVAFVTMACSERLVCYYDRKAAARSFLGKFTPANINPFLCTHIIYSYAAIDDKNNKNRLIPVDPADLILYNDLIKLKSVNPNLKTLLAVGDPSGNDDQAFSVMVASPNTRRNFIDSVILLFREYSFDGLNLDWRYPDVNANSKKFTTLCQELRTAFSSESLLLTASVSATQTSGYEVSKIAPELDFINVLTYNFHSPTETGHSTSQSFRSIYHKT